MKKPIVSVLMTSYNRQDFIEEAIQSVLSSSLKDFELIICDDASSDKTVEIARRYEKIDNRVKVFVNDANLGDYPNRNKVASYAAGKYLKYLDSDDIIYPWGLEAMVHSMEAFPNAGFGLIGYQYCTEEKLPIMLSPLEAYHAFVFKSALISAAPSGAIIKRSVFEQNKGFSGKQYVGDFELWFKLAQENPVVVLPLDLVWWRKHAGQQYNEGVNNNYYENERFWIYKNALTDENCPLSVNQRKAAIRNLTNLHSRIILHKLITGNFRRSFQLFTHYGLSIADIFKSLRFNTYPSLN